MHPLDLAKLHHHSPDSIPGLTAPHFDNLMALQQVIPSPANSLRYWGLVSSHHTYRGHHMLRCYNFGNAVADYPWPVRLINFGIQEPTTIHRVGTIKKSPSTSTPLDQATSPYLVFEYDPTPALSEHLQPGLLITPGDSPSVQHQEYTILLAEENHPASFTQPSLLYYLMRPVPFKVMSIDRWIPPGAPFGYPAIHIRLELPLYLELGWPIALSDEDSTFWGIVLQ